MKALMYMAAVLLALGSHASHAGIVNGSFEAGLVGWTTLGDVSIQGAEIGISPAAGQRQVLLTTLCDSAKGECDSTPERPYSGSNAVLNLSQLASFLHMPGPVTTANFPDVVGITPLLGLDEGYSAAGESSAIRTLFFAHQGASIQFDWNFISADGADAAYLVVAGADPQSDFFKAETLFYGRPPLGNGIELPTCPPYCNGTRETGYTHGSVSVPYSGWFYPGFGITESPEGTVASGLLLDNIRLIPEPSSMMILLGAVLLLAAGRKRRNVRHALRDDDVRLAST